jgi:hypothetical protein
MVTVDLGGTTLGAGTYRLINYFGTLTGSFASTPVILNGSTTQSAIIGQNIPGQINLIVGTPAPLGFDGVVRSGMNLIFSDVGGQAGSNYLMLVSTNLAQPLSGWTPVLTNTFDGSGNFNFTNPMGQEQQIFYTIRPQ